MYLPTTQLGRSTLSIPTFSAEAGGAVSISGTRNQFYDRTAAYNFLWMYYVNTAYDSLNYSWNSLRVKNRYYRFTRAIFNPTRRLVDLYAGSVWPGVLTADAEDIPKNFQIAVPFSKSTDEKVAQAAGQVFQWSNFASQRYALIRQCAALGNLLVEIVDDVDSGKITFDLVWPGHVKDLILDRGGHVRSHTVQYRYYDPADDKEYTYTRAVTQDRISTYRDGVPYSYDGVPSSYENVYGFDPSVWVTHANIGGIFGMPAIRNVTKIDELNSLVSHANDQIHKILSAPIVLGIHSPEAPLPEQQTDEAPPQALQLGSLKERDVIDYIESNIGAEVSTINLPEGQALRHIEELLKEIERDSPELSMWHSMRELNQVSGIAVERLFGDAAIYIYEAQTNYDVALTRLLQMSIAIGGMRAREGAGGWSETNYQRKKFDGFDLESYRKGDLEIAILPRPLVTPTQTEAVQLEILQAQADRLKAEMENPQPGGADPTAINLPNGVFGRVNRLTQPPPANGNQRGGPQQSSQQANRLSQT